MTEPVDPIIKMQQESPELLDWLLERIKQGRAADLDRLLTLMENVSTSMHDWSMKQPDPELAIVDITQRMVKMFSYGASLTVWWKETTIRQRITFLAEHGFTAIKVPPESFADLPDAIRTYMLENQPSIPEMPGTV